MRMVSFHSLAHLLNGLAVSFAALATFGEAKPPSPQAQVWLYLLSIRFAHTHNPR